MEFKYILKFSADLHWKLQNNPMLIMAQMNLAIHISQLAQWSKLDLVQFAHKVQQRHSWQSKEWWYFLFKNRKGHVYREEENEERNYSKYNVSLAAPSWLKRRCNKIFNTEDLKQFWCEHAFTAYHHSISKTSTLIQKKTEVA